MELISEVDTVLSGEIKMDTNQLKAIAVSETTIKPDENGVVPLSKQSAMKIEKPILEELPENEMLETLEDEPIEVAPLETLDSFDFSPEKEEEIVEPEPEPEPVEEPVEDEPIDIELPKVEDSLVQEPSEVNDNLFVNNEMEPLGEVPTLEEQEQKPEETIEEAIEEPKEAIHNNGTKPTVDLEEILQRGRELKECADRISKEFEEKYIEFVNAFEKMDLENSSEIKENQDLNNKLEEADEELTVPSLENEEKESSNLIEEATNQINNIKVPTVSEEPVEDLPAVDDTKIKGMFI